MIKNFFVSPNYILIDIKLKLLLLLFLVWTLYFSLSRVESDVSSNILGNLFPLISILGLLYCSRKTHPCSLFFCTKPKRPGSSLFFNTIQHSLYNYLCYTFIIHAKIMSEPLCCLTKTSCTMCFCNLIFEFLRCESCLICSQNFS